MTYTTPDNITGIAQIISYGNEVTNNFLITSILITIYLITFLYTVKKMKMTESLIVAGMVNFLFTFFFYLWQLTNERTLYISILLVAVGVVSHIWNNR